MAKKDEAQIKDETGLFTAIINANKSDSDKQAKAQTAKDVEAPKPASKRTTTARVKKTTGKTTERAAEAKRKEVEAPGTEDAADGKTCYSVWLSKQEIKEIERYMMLKNITRADLTRAAITQYMKKYPITDDEKRAFMANMGLI